jgi:(R,R)-butanediol dehydrogenase/meso-butanediol dehydrogenase/diacetyl reductase
MCLSIANAARRSRTRELKTDWRSEMHAACYVGDKTLQIIEHEPRSPADREVTIDVAYTRICGTDLHILHGAMDARVSLSAVLGHEMPGTISEVGVGVAMI